MLHGERWNTPPALSACLSFKVGRFNDDKAGTWYTIGGWLPYKCATKHQCGRRECRVQTSILLIHLVAHVLPVLLFDGHKVVPAPLHVPVRMGGGLRVIHGCSVWKGVGGVVQLMQLFKLTQMWLPLVGSGLTIL